MTHREDASGDVIDERVLTPIDYGCRPGMIREAMGERQIDALVIAQPANLRWCCGFSGSTGFLVVTDEHMTLIVDGRYGERARAEVTSVGVDLEIVVAATQSDIDLALSEACAPASRHAVALEGGHLAHDRFVGLADTLRTTQNELDIRSVGGMFAELRRRKQQGEIERMSAAAAIADNALRVVLPMVCGMTERELQAELEYQMLRLGSQGASFETIIASGPQHGARPHHHTSRRAIGEGDTMIVDLGATVDGYHSDMTRSFVVGDATAHQRARYDVLVAAQAAGVAAVRAETPCREVDAAIRHVLSEADLEPLFVHGTGHGVGLEIHEIPFLGRSSSDVLMAGDVITVEPGLYEPGFGGFRIEDMVAVSEVGALTLTHTPIDIAP